MPEPTRSTARAVREWIDLHPSIADAVRLGITNHSALARRIAADLGTEHMEGIIAACRRYPVGGGDHRERTIGRVLGKSRIETRTKVATITVEQGTDVLRRLGDVVEEILDENGICRLIQVSRGTVIVVDEDSIPRFTRKLKEAQIISVRRGLVEIAVTSPESIEETPGLLARLTSVLSGRSINIVQAMSCYTDTIFVLERSDMSAGVDALSRALG